MSIGFTISRNLAPKGNPISPKSDEADWRGSLRLVRGRDGAPVFRLDPRVVFFNNISSQWQWQFWQNLTIGKACHRLIAKDCKESAYGNHEHFVTGSDENLG